MAAVDTFIEKFPEELRGGIREVIERNGGFDAHRRGVLHPDDTARLADGNAANVLTNLAVHPAAAGVDAVRSAVTSQPRTVLLSELPSQVVGAVVGVERGITEAMFSLRNGVNGTR